MSTELSPSTRALLRSARDDAPSAASRARILGGVASATSATALGVAAKTAGGTKLLLTGALFGSIVTVGVAAFVLGAGVAPHFSHGPPLSPDPSFAMHADPELAPVAPAAMSAMPARVAEEPEAIRPSAPARHAGTRVHPSVAPDDSLAREGALVREARGALVRGQAETALGALRATELLPSRALEPEELSLEARALRALGRDPEAAFVENQLRARFPDNALSH
jgi:hypothetical protein